MYNREKKVHLTTSAVKMGYKHLWNSKFNFWMLKQPHPFLRLAFVVGRSRLMPFRGLNETSPRRESQLILNAHQSRDLLHVSDNTVHHHIPPRTRRRRSIFLRFNRLGGKFFGRLGVITTG